jgi:hypothetical protein
MKKDKKVSMRPRLDRGSWQKLLRAQEASELSIKDFCAAQGLSPASFYQWRNRIQGGGPSKGALFSPIEIQKKAFGGLTVELPGNVLLRFLDLPPVEYLRELSSRFSGQA